MFIIFMKIATTKQNITGSLADINTYDFHSSRMS